MACLKTVLMDGSCSRQQRVADWESHARSVVDLSVFKRAADDVVDDVFSRMVCIVYVSTIGNMSLNWLHESCCIKRNEFWFEYGFSIEFIYARNVRVMNHMLLLVKVIAEGGPEDVIDVDTEIECVVENLSMVGYEELVMEGIRSKAEELVKIDWVKIKDYEF